MFRLWCQRLVLIAAAVLMPALTIEAARNAPGEAPAHVSLAGQLLIASPEMSDPRFVETVILLVRHERDGAMGIIINRPVAEQPIAKLLDAMGQPSDEVTGQVQLFLGGPVSPEYVFVLHSAEYRQPDTREIGTRMAMTTDLAIVRDMATGKGPRKTLLALGYAGWRAGQLEREIELGAWHLAPSDVGIVFDEDRSKVWDLAMARRNREL